MAEMERSATASVDEDKEDRFPHKIADGNVSVDAANSLKSY